MKRNLWETIKDCGDPDLFAELDALLIRIKAAEDVCECVGDDELYSSLAMYEAVGRWRAARGGSQ